MSCQISINNLISDETTSLLVDTGSASETNYEVPNNSYLLELLIYPEAPVPGSFTFALDLNNTEIVAPLVVDSGLTDITSVLLTRNINN